MSRLYTLSRHGRRKYSTATIAGVAGVAAVAIGGVAGAVTLTGESHGNTSLTSASPSHGWASPGATPAAPSYAAVANVTPPVAATTCASPSTFTYSGTLSASAPGTVRYQWVYSSGQPGPARTVSFTAAGQHEVTGGTVTANTAGSGWGAIKLLSPVGRTSDRAAYKLLCGGSGAGGVTVTAAVTPATRTAVCATGVPAFTAAGSIEASRAEAVTYYWAQSSGKDSAPATLTFTGPGTRPAAPLTITPPAASGAGEAVLVVTSPVAAASAPATYTLTCKAPPTTATSGPANSASNPTSPDSGPSNATGPASNPTSPVSNPTSPASNPTSPASSPPNPTTAPASIPAPPPTTAPPAPQPSQNPGSLASADSLSDTLNLGSYVNIATTASGGTPPYTWTESGLPSWVKENPGGFNQMAYSLTGTGEAAGSYPFTVTLSDSAGDSVTGHYVLTVVAPTSENWNVGPLYPTQAFLGTPYSGGLPLSGQTSGITFAWTVTAGSLPPGLTLNQDGTITGTPTALGLFNFSIVVTDVATGAAKQGGTYNFSVYPAGTIP